MKATRGKRGLKKYHTPFTEEIGTRICELARKGLTLTKVASILGLSPNTIIYWTRRYPDFLWNLNEARLFADDYVEKCLFTRASGYTHQEEKIFFQARSGKIFRAKTFKHYPPDVLAQIFWLKNRRPDQWKQAETGPQGSKLPIGGNGEPKPFSAFCVDAGYPPPYLKQVEMKDFGIAVDETVPRILLGSRGYGKTDYVVILGIAYQIYLEVFSGKELEWSVFLLTKSEARNAAILTEIAKACENNGIAFEKKSSQAIRVVGQKGKEASVSAATIGSATIRGRHPKLVVMEDVITEEDVSPATRRRVQRTYNEVTKLCQNVLLIGQPVHKHDLYETLRPKLKKMEVPYGSIPELDVDLEAQRLAGVSEESIQASYFLNVTSETDSPFDGVQYIAKFPNEGDAVAFIDPSFKGVDYTALTIAKAYFEGVVVQGHVFKKAWNHCLDLMVHRMLDCGVKRVAFETNSLGDQPVIMLREALPSIGVVGKNSSGAKHSRIVAAGAYAHLIHLAKTSDPIYINQVVQYEYGAEFDDAPDSLASLLEWLGLIRGKRPQ